MPFRKSGLICSPNRTACGNHFEKHFLYVFEFSSQNISGPWVTNETGGLGSNEDPSRLDD